MMRVVMIVLLSITAAFAVDKDNGKFQPGKASTYPGHQTLDKITIAAVPYYTSQQAAEAFGKKNPYQEGILPVLVLLENGTGKTIRADLKAEFVDLSNRHVEAMPPGDVVLFNGVRKPPSIPGTGPSPIPLPRRNKKGPLNTWEIEGRAFVAKLIPPGEAVHGFVYFNTSYKEGSKLYVTGLKDAASGADYFYFEVPIQKP
jgi:hypothetical protein